MSIETAKAEREKEVREQIEYLSKSLSSLSLTVESLAPTLGDVLSSGMPSDAGVDEPVKSLCNLAEEIRNLRYSVETIQNSIQDTLSRIEV